MVCPALAPPYDCRCSFSDVESPTLCRLYTNVAIINLRPMPRHQCDSEQRLHICRGSMGLGGSKICCRGPRSINSVLHICMHEQHAPGHHVCRAGCLPGQRVLGRAWGIIGRGDSAPEPWQQCHTAVLECPPACPCPHHPTGFPGRLLPGR